ncbi:hypothetical protein ABPG75_008326 [Micractinium tetrahymenae]
MAPVCELPIAQHMPAYAAWWQQQRQHPQVQASSDGSSSDDPASLLASTLVLLARAAAHPAPATLPELIQQAAGIAAQLTSDSCNQQVPDQLAALAAPPAPASDAGQLQPSAPAAGKGAPQLLVTARQLRCTLDWQLVVVANALLGHQGQGTAQPDTAVAAHVHTAPPVEQRSAAQSALAAVEQAEAALQRSREELPASWVHSLQACLASTKAQGQPSLENKGRNGGTGTAVGAAAAAQGSGKPTNGSTAAAPLLLPHQRADPPGARAVARERAEKQQFWLTVGLDSCLLFCLTVCCESALGACCESCFSVSCDACCST